MNHIVLKHKISEVIISMIIFLLINGWFKNIFQLCVTDCTPLRFFRITGIIIFPLGGILGYF